MANALEPFISGCDEVAAVYRVQVRIDVNGTFLNRSLDLQGEDFQSYLPELAINV
jgi:hypothetical protein